MHPNPSLGYTYNIKKKDNYLKILFPSYSSFIVGNPTNKYCNVCTGTQKLLNFVPVNNSYLKV